MLPTILESEGVMDTLRSIHWPWISNLCLKWGLQSYIMLLASMGAHSFNYHKALPCVRYCAMSWESRSIIPLLKNAENVGSILALIVPYLIYKAGEKVEL